MTLFPFTRPKIGLYVTAEAFSVAHVHRRFGHQSFDDYEEQPIPAGCIRLSPVEPNILERETVISNLQAVFDHRKGPQSVALCLPDLCARTTILEMASLPKNPKEQQALVEWRLKRDLKLSKEHMRVSFQHLASTSGWIKGTPTPDQPVRLLATAVQENILQAYENACLEAGLIPASIHLASFAVFNVCKPMMEAILSQSTGRISFVPDTQFFLYLADWGFSLIAVRNRTPIFLRVKPLRHTTPWLPQNIQHRTELDPQEPSEPGSAIDGAEEPTASLEQDNLRTFSPQTAAFMTNELVGTLQYYFETHEMSFSTDEVYPLFLIGSQVPDQALPKIAELIEQEFPWGSELDKPRIKAFPLIPGTANLSLKSLSGLPTWTSTSLPAFAAPSQS
jgi:Tfp pilus assembly PilM family ATPase